MENDLIRRGDALCVVADNNRTDHMSLDCYDRLIGGLADLPAVDAVEVVHGEWGKMDMHKSIENYKCSVCRSECYVPEAMGEPMFPLCPYCGARMDGRREDGDA